MSWFHNLSFGWKIRLPVLALLVLLVLVGINGLLVQGTLATNARQLGSNYISALDLLLQADRDMYQSQAAERGLVFLDATAPGYDGLQTELTDNQQQALERALKASSLSPAIARIAPADRIRELHNRWARGQAELVSARAGAGAGDPALAALTYGQLDADFSALRDLIDQAGEAHQQSTEAFIRQAEADAASARNFATSLLAIGALLGLAISVLLPPLFTRGLVQINATMADIAEGEGDLTFRTQQHSRDELGSLSRSFNKFMDKLQHTIGRAKDNSGQVRDSATEVSDLGAANRQSMASQNSALRAVVTAVAELSQTVSDIARNTNLTAEQARNANDLTRSGSGLVNRTRDQIATLADRVGETSGLINEVQQQAREANSVLDVIRGIAEQTNLLALNAAIEAARAGEQGRGFAVVADEVRTLASKTQDSTQHIQKMLEALQAGVQNAVRAMESASQDALATADAANEANSSLTAINDAVADITQKSIQIATAAEEQSAVIREVNSNLGQMDQQAQDSGQRIEQAAHASENLNRLAVDLQQLLGGFRC